MDQLGIEFISVFGLPPVEFVHLAADLEVRNISLGLSPLDANPHNYPSYALSDAALQRDFKAALKDRGVGFALAEGFFVLPGRDVSAYAAEMDLMAELGAQRINTLALEPDAARLHDQLATLVEMGAARGLRTTLEFIPGMRVGDLTAAAETVRQVGRPEVSVLADTMHLGRSGATGAELAALEPGVVGYAQLCDCPLVRSDMSYADEAKYERMVPGEGELPLVDYLKALPPGVVIGLEVPQRSLAEAGVGPHERLGRAVAAARALLAQAAAQP
ncbi:TIM barrel protein [Phenylobacterium sp. LjRoot219]|uniref:sugar phosphate isomerase/epimerase family protein n=1 Tax=Phenylobacterium sp. LjRoot219 TaxID=3342283 RepID=UPI003ED0757A